MPNNFIVKLLEDGNSFRIKRGSWINDYPISALEGWIDFYIKLRNDHPKNHHAYDATIDALVAFRDKLRAAQEP